MQISLTADALTRLVAAMEQAEPESLTIWPLKDQTRHEALLTRLRVALAKAEA